MNLTTLDNLKVYLGIDDSQTKNDETLEQLIEYTSSLFESYCERVFELSENVLEEYPMGDAMRELYLTNTPVVSVDAIILDGVDTTSSTTYKLDKKGGKVLFDYPIVCDEFEASYTGGYNEDTLPVELTFMCNLQVAFFFQRRDNIGLRQVSMEGSFTTEAGYELLDQVKQVLNKYRYINI